MIWGWVFYSVIAIGAGTLLMVVIGALISGAHFKRAVSGTTMASLIQAVVKLNTGTGPGARVVRGRFGWHYNYVNEQLYTFVRISRVWIRVPNFTAARYLLTIAGLSTKP